MATTPDPSLLELMKYRGGRNSCGLGRPVITIYTAPRHALENRTEVGRRRGKLSSYWVQSQIIPPWSSSSSSQYFSTICTAYHGGCFVEVYSARDPPKRTWKKEVVECKIHRLVIFYIQHTTHVVCLHYLPQFDHHHRHRSSSTRSSFLINVSRKTVALIVSLISN